VKRYLLSFSTILLLFIISNAKESGVQITRADRHGESRGFPKPYHIEEVYQHSQNTVADYTESKFFDFCNKQIMASSTNFYSFLSDHDETVLIRQSIMTNSFGPDQYWRLFLSPDNTHLHKSLDGPINSIKLLNNDIGFFEKPIFSNSYFRSTVSSGSWSDKDSWEWSPDGLDNWVSSLWVPDQEASSIHIRNGHSITISNGISLNNTIVDGTLILITGGKIAIPEDFDAGIIINPNGSLKVATSDSYLATFSLPKDVQGIKFPIHVASGGRVIIDKPESGSPGTGFEFLASSSENRWDDAARFIWNNGLPFATNGIVYFPTSGNDLVPIFQINSPVVTGSAPNPLTINGLLTVNAKTSLGGTGNKNFRNGITGSDTLEQLAATDGRIIIMNENAILGGSDLHIKMNSNTPMYLEKSVTVPEDSFVTITGANIQNRTGQFTINGTFDIKENQVTNNGSIVVGSRGTFRSQSPGNNLWPLISVPSGTVILNIGSTIELYAEGDQNFSSRTDFTNLIFSGSGIKRPSSKFSTHKGTITIKDNAILDCSTARVGETSIEGNVTNLTMSGGRLITGTTGTSPAMEGSYNLTGGIIEFSNNSVTPQTIRGKNYSNIEVTGKRVFNSSGIIGIKPNGSFIIRGGGIYTSTSGNASIEGIGGSGQAFRIEKNGLFKTEVREGFYGPPGMSGYSPSVRNSILLIDLQQGSTIEYSRDRSKGDPDDITGGNQNITFHKGVYEYQNLILSGEDKKIAPENDLVIKGDFIRKGSAEFIHNSGTVIFDNITSQKIDADNSVFYNIDNKNLSGLIIESDLSVKNALQLSENSILHLNTGNITIVSDATGTGRVNEIPDNAKITYNDDGGRFKVERFIPNHPKAWQLMGVNTFDGTIKEAWQNNQLNEPARGVWITSPYYTPLSTKGFDGYSPAPSVKYYDPATNLYSGVTSTENIISDHAAYFLFVRGDRTVKNVGEPPKEVTLHTRGKLYSPGINAPSPITVYPKQWALLGNPYASAIDFEKLDITAEIELGYYVWDPNLTTTKENGGTSEYGLGAFRYVASLGNGVYEVIPSGGNYPLNNPPLIQSGQGFFVFNPYSAPGTISFPESAKSTQSINVFRKGDKEESIIPKIKTNLFGKSDGEWILLDGTLQLFSENYSSNVDNHDARKILNNGENIFLPSEKYPLIFERRPFPVEGDTIFLEMTGMNKRDYLLNLSIDQLSSFNHEIYINDSYLNSSALLQEGENPVHFTIDNQVTSPKGNRYFLTFKKAVPTFHFFNERAEVLDKKIKISWEIGNHQMIEYFVLEHSNDGKFFEIIKQKMITNPEEDFYFLHDQPGFGMHFYRIKALLKDGSSVFSEIISENFVQYNASIVIFPNPVKDKIQFSFSGLPLGNYRGRLLSMDGKVFWSGKFEHLGGHEIHKILVPHLTVGIYQFEMIKPDGMVIVEKILVQ